MADLGKVCANPSCKKGFGFFVKKYTCHGCQGNFCRDCSSKNHNFPSHGVLENTRLCPPCLERIRVEDARTSMTLAGGDMPDKSGIDSLLEEMMEERQLKGAVRDKMRAMPLAQKWMMVQAQKQEASQRKLGASQNDPSHWVDVVSGAAVSEKDLATLTHVVRGQTKTWVSQFMIAGGLGALLAALQAPGRSLDLKLSGLQCVSALLGTDVGLKQFVKLPEAVGPLVLMCMFDQDEVKEEVLAILSFVVTADVATGYPVVYEALADPARGRVPFRFLVNALSDPHAPPQVKREVMVLVNALINGPDLLEDRLHTRETFVSAGITAAIAGLRDMLFAYHQAQNGGAAAISGALSGSAGGGLPPPSFGSSLAPPPATPLQVQVMSPNDPAFGSLPRGRPAARSVAPASPVAGGSGGFQPATPAPMTAATPAAGPLGSPSQFVGFGLGGMASPNAPERAAALDQLAVQLDLYDQAAEEDRLEATRGGIDYSDIASLQQFLKNEVGVKFGGYLLPLLQLLVAVPLTVAEGQPVWETLLLVARRLITPDAADQASPPRFEELFQLADAAAKKAKEEASVATIIANSERAVEEQRQRAHQAAMKLAAAQDELSKVQAQLDESRAATNKAIADLEAAKKAAPVAAAAAAPAAASTVTTNNVCPKCATGGAGAGAGAGAGVPPPPPGLDELLGIPAAPDMGDLFGGGGGGAVPPPPDLGDLFGGGGGGGVPPPPDLGDLFGGGGGGVPAPPGLDDLFGGGGGVPAPPGLDDLFGGGGGVPAPPGLDDLFGGGGSAPAPRAVVAAPPKPKLPYVKKEVKPAVKMRALHWAKVEEKDVEKTIWNSLNDSRVPIDAAELEALFCTAAPRPAAAADKEGDEKAAAAAAAAAAAPVAVTFVDGQRSQNIAIAISRFKPLTFEAIRDALLAMDSSVLSAEKVATMLKWLPQADELEAIASFDGPVAQLGNVERYFSAIGQIPRLERRLDVFSFMQGFDAAIAEASAKNSVCLGLLRAIAGSTKLKKVLEYVLALGNYLNGGSAKGGAYGFKIAFLTKLANTKTCDNKSTLLHYLVQQLERDPSDPLGVIDELAATAEAMRVDLPSLQSDINKLVGGVKKAENELKVAKPSDTDRFAPVVSAFVANAGSRAQALADEAAKLTAEAEALAGVFGEEAGKFGPDVIFPLFHEFTQQLKLTRTALAKAAAEKERQERLQAAKEASAAARAAAGGAAGAAGAPGGDDAHRGSVLKAPPGPRAAPMGAANMGALAAAAAIAHASRGSQAGPKTPDAAAAAGKPLPGAPATADGAAGDDADAMARQVGATLRGGNSNDIMKEINARRAARANNSGTVKRMFDGVRGSVLMPAGSGPLVSLMGLPPPPPARPHPPQ